MVRVPNGCPACGQDHAEGTMICPVTGVSLRFSDPKKAIGEVIGGKYRIDQVLGRGGMGAVYEAEHMELQKKVAIKILLPESSMKPSQVERFKREARSAASIGHDNIVQIFDLDTTEDGTIYIVMELLPGYDLADLMVRETGGLPVGRAAHIAYETALGLGAAHEHGIIHRDLKPENIFLARKPQGEQVKIVDFGIAMMRRGDAGRLTAEGVLIGTPFYMSPEQARGERNPTPKTDIYALGTVLYEMLTGAVLFDGDTYLEILAKHQVDPPPPLVERRPDLQCPAEMEDLIRRMLAKEPGDRPSSMSEVAGILGRHAGASQPSPAAEGKPQKGYAETILAYQRPQPAVSAQAVQPADLAMKATIESSDALEWSDEAGPSPTTLIRKDTRRRRLAVLGGLAGVLVAGGITAAVVTGVGPGRRAAKPEPEPALAAGVEKGADEKVEEAAGIEHVTIEVDVSPPSAVIIIDGSRLEGNPVKVEVESGTTVTLRAEAVGYTTLEKEIIADSNRSFAWQLEPLPAKRPRGKGGKTPPPAAPDPPKGTGDTGGKGKKIKVDKDNPYLGGS